MSEKYNEAYLRTHNARTMLELIVSYLAQNESEESAENVLFAAETALREVEQAEQLLGGIN